MKKWLKKGSAVLLAVTMVLTLFPGMQTTVQAAEKVEKKYWTDVAGLKEFNLSSSAAIGKIRFGLDNGNSRIWAICGTDGNDLALLSTSAFEEAAYGTTSEYSKSNFVTGMDTYLSTAYFSDKELEKMADVTVSTNEPNGSGGNHAVTVANKKLYLPNLYDQKSNKDTKIYIGSGNNIEIDVKKLTKANGFQDNFFWLRSPDGYNKTNALVAIPDYYVYYYDVSTDTNSVVPAFNLNLSSVLFASAANAASSDGKLTVTENTYTLRYASTTDENGIISSDGGSVRVKDATGKFLVAQNNSGAYAKKINGNDETITVAQMGTGTEITNFNDCKVWIESTGADRIATAKTCKNSPVLTVNPITKTYDGTPVADSEINGTATVGGDDVSGTWKFEDGQKLTDVKDSDTKNVIFTPDDPDKYEEVQGTLELTIKKAKPTGSPIFTKITEAGKTLADADLVKIDTTPENGFNVSGTVKWDDDDNTVVEANKSYGWTFTPNDTDNYETAKDSIIVYATGGGGGSVTPAPTPGGSVSDNEPVAVAQTPADNRPIDANAAQKATVKEALAGGAKAITLTYTEGNKTVDKEIFKAIAGKDITVTFNMGDAWWIVNGKDIPTDMDFKDLNLGVIVDSNGTKNLIPADVINPLTGEVNSIQCELLHNGPFGFKMYLHIKLGQEYSGMSALLRYYNEATGVLEDVTEGVINADGIVLLPMEHASRYVISIGVAGMSKQNTPAPAAPVEAAPKSPKTGEDGFSAYYVVLIAVAGIGTVLAGRKCRQEN